MNLIDSPELIRSKVFQIFRQLLSEVSSVGCKALSGAEIEALSSCCSVFACAFPGSAEEAAAKNMLCQVWEEGERRVSGGELTAEAMYTVLAMYHVAYSTEVSSAYGSYAEKCDRMASSMTAELCKGGAGLAEEAAAVMLASNLYCYALPEDMEDDAVVGYCREKIEVWNSAAANLPEEFASSQQEMSVMQCLLAAEYAGFIGEGLRPALPAPAQLSTTGGLSALCRIIAHRMDDAEALLNAVCALEDRLTSGFQGCCAAASLVEALCALHAVSEERLVLNCA